MLKQLRRSEILDDYEIMLRVERVVEPHRAAQSVHRIVWRSVPKIDQLSFTSNLIISAIPKGCQPCPWKSTLYTGDKVFGTHNRWRSHFLPKLQRSARSQKIVVASDYFELLF